jgi:hypothetical protein
MNARMRRAWAKGLAGGLVLAAAAASAAAGSTQASWRDWMAEETGRPPAMAFPYQGCFEAAAARHDLPVTLLLAVARGESNFDPRAVSRANAHGLMQILWPSTARELGFETIAELQQPCPNVDAGARYLRGLMDRYGEDVHLALAAYNYGPGRIPVDGGRIPAGAEWYSGYIRRHLDFVLNGRGQWSGQARQTVAVFRTPWRAEALVAALSSRAPDVRLDWFREGPGEFHVVLVAGGGSELAAARSRLGQLGWEFR